MEIIRRISQLFGFIISHSYLKFLDTKQVYQGPFKANCVPFFSCHACPAAVFSCPIGTLQHYAVIRMAPWAELGSLGLILIAVGRMVCGWLCPFGLLQDLLYKIKSIKVKIPKWTHNFRYFIFIFMVLLIPYLHGELTFCHFCPVGTLEAAIPWVVWDPISREYGLPVIDPTTIGFQFCMKIFIFVVLIVFMVISKRPFCRVLCPLSVILSVFNRFSLVRMTVEKRHLCRKSCTLCLNGCPMELKVSDDPNSGECIRCLKCTKCKKVKIGIGYLKDPVIQYAMKTAGNIASESPDKSMPPGAPSPQDRED
jgi:polyferredoxin